jgi:isopentenyl diphosphate isomerase/L-lactate dehydrogenase-like FMN-dependent dehydrogenase
LQIEALPEIVEAVKGSHVEVYLDGGVTQGTDVVKAIALGAKMVRILKKVNKFILLNLTLGLRG